MSPHGDPDARGRPSPQDAGGSSGDGVLADRLSELARSLEQQEDVGELLAQIVGAAVGTVPGVQDASVSRIEGRHAVRTLAATSELPREVDRAQYETGEGPCLDALYHQDTVRLSDLTADRRWPAFLRRATGLGVGSMLAVQLFVEGDDLGALNLVSRERDAFGDEAEHVALLFASHAAVALSGAEERGRLTAAVGTRDLIGQAKGILMERFRITHDQAFRLLVRASQDSNAKLRDVAEELTRSGTLPSRPAD